MTKSFHARPFRAIGFALVAVLCLAGLASFSAQGAFSAPAVNDEAALLDGFRHVEVASVSDAIEKLSGQRMYMSHRMRPIFPAKFAGIALTVQLKKEENQDPAALQGMLTAIDRGGANSVYVMVVEDGVDIAGVGGLMGTAMAARNFSGAVIDGGVRDVAYLQKIGFPVFALGIVPSTSIHHYRFAGANVPVMTNRPQRIWRVGIIRFRRHIVATFRAKIQWKQENCADRCCNRIIKGRPFWSRL